MARSKVREEVIKEISGDFRLAEAQIQIGTIHG